ncbi:MAG: CHAD domain-containing protein, partial [Anaerolineales bacterium]|nr:CHAD domain-containing protein [Anaerolineales bacterium]
MAYALARGEGIADGMRRIVGEQIDAIVAGLTDEAVDRDTAVHDARKRFKRLRAALRLVRDALDADVYRRENMCYRDAARLLAGARDSAVLIAVLDGLTAAYADELAAADAAGIRAGLVARYEAVQQAAFAQGDVVPRVLETLAAARERAAALPIAADDFAALAPGLARVYRRGRQRMRAIGAGAGTAAQFHDWRKRVKYLWHQVEILQESWPPVLRPWGDELHRLADVLGDEHDLTVLAETVRADEARFGGEAARPALLALVARRRAELQAAARPLGARLYAEKPRQFVARQAAYWAAWQMPHGEADVAADTAVPLAARLLTTREAADRLGVTVRDVRQRLRDGRLAG